MFFKLCVQPTSIFEFVYPLVNGFRTTVDLGGSSIKQRDRLTSDSLLRLHMSILHTSLGACSSEHFFALLEVRFRRQFHQAAGQAAFKQLALVLNHYSSCKSRHLRSGLLSCFA